MDLINKIIKVLIDPLNFFADLKKEKGVKKAFIYLLILLFFSTILGTVVGYLAQSFSFNIVSKILNLNLPQPEYSFGTIFFWALVGYPISALLSFVWAGLLHVWILIFRGKADYTKTYQLYIYSQTPRFVFGWIPIVSSFIWIYDLVLLIIGTEKVHEISRLRAVLMYIIPIGLLILFYILIIILVIFVFKTNPSFLAGLSKA